MFSNTLLNTTRVCARFEYNNLANSYNLANRATMNE